ncbi:MAG: capsular polysaccharide synthesis protein, partial [Prevotellaceae bacterium]|nr:capsular polysaccharide synthesis protein [Prevotellaceae bacterium]
MKLWQIIKKEHKAWKKARKVKKDLIVQREVANKLDGYITDFLDGKIEKVTITAKKPELVGKKIIWQFWQQGVDETTPKLVKTCFDSVQKFRGEYEVILLSKETLTDYVDDFPDYVWGKYGTGGFVFPKIANLVRLYLLSAYGGVWLDATILLTAPINENWLKQDFFALQRDDTPPFDVKKFTKFDPIGLSWSPQSYVRMQNSFMIAKPHNKIIDDLISIHLEYWKKEENINHYFFFQIMFNRMMQHEE